MVVTQEEFLAVRCPKCGKLHMEAVSIFAFSGYRTVEIACECSEPLARLSTEDRKKYSFRITCPLCDSTHSFPLSAREMWGGRMVTLTCPESGLEIAFWGQKAEVGDRAARTQVPLEELLDEIDYQEFFESPDSMLRVLEYLQKAARQGDLYCRCGNASIEVDIFPDKVELRCPYCRGTVVIYGRNDDDVELLRTRLPIELATGSFACLGESPLPPRSRKN